MKTAVLCKDLTGDPVEKDVPGETEAGGSRGPHTMKCKQRRKKLDARQEEKNQKSSLYK